MPQIGRQTLVPVFDRHVLEPVPLIVRRIVHQHGDWPQPPPHLGDRRLQRSDVLQIAVLIEWLRVAGGLDPADQRLRRIVGDIDERHLCSLRRELRHMLGADAAGAAGDEHHAVAQARIDRE